MEGGRGVGGTYLTADKVESDWGRTHLYTGNHGNLALTMTFLSNDSQTVALMQNAHIAIYIYVFSLVFKC